MNDCPTGSDSKYIYPIPQARKSPIVLLRVQCPIDARRGIAEGTWFQCTSFYLHLMRAPQTLGIPRTIIENQLHPKDFPAFLSTALPSSALPPPPPAQPSPTTHPPQRPLVLSAAP